MKSLADLLGSIVPRRPHELTAPTVPTCPACNTSFGDGDWPLFLRFGVCDTCGHHFNIPARERIRQLADPDSFREVNRSLASVDPLAFADRLPYTKRLAEARKKTGATEAVVTGTCRVGGSEVVLAVLDFDFLGGSMGSVVGEKVALAMELAARRKMPLITVSTSGGARMQEGMLSLVQMAKTAAAARRLHEARQPFISVLANPTTGGIYASYASLGDVVIAEPGALIGFAGPRVVEQTMHQSGAIDSHQAEYLQRHGAIDQIVERPKLRDRLVDLLGILTSRFRLEVEGGASRASEVAPIEPNGRDAWETVQLARHPERPTAMDYIQRMTSGFFELHGDRYVGDDAAIVVGFANLAGQSVAIVGQQRGTDGADDPTRGGRPMPEGYRKALRLMHLAAKFGMPLITLIDTPGAYAGVEAEDRGLAQALAECLSYMSGVQTQTLAVVIGEGGSGGALALGVADRVLMLENAIYSVISPEGAAAILYRDTARAEQLAGALRITAPDCKDLGVVEEVVPEPDGGAHRDAEHAAHLLQTALVRALVDVQRVPLRKTLKARYQKFRRMGKYNRHFNAAVAREVEQLQDLVRRVQALREHLPGHRPAEADS